LEEGLDAAALTAKFGQENTAAIIARLNKLTKEGLLISAGSVYRLAPHRILTSNPIFARVLTDED
jgi:coproporphyrinogen III oxidase-like Fe-S oxidoreductase